MGPEIGSHPLIKRFLKGVFRSRPTKPKYRFTWNPAVVLRYVETLGDNQQLSLETLSKKVLILLALTIAHRIQTLSSIKMENIIQQSDELQILIPDLIKTSNPNNFQPILRLPFFKHTVHLCVASALRSYIKKTEKIRISPYLFISYKKPHGKVSSQSLSRWIKNVLYNSGVDTKIFKGHSTRHASTSAAKQAGVCLDEIKRTACWTVNSSVFQNFTIAKL